MRYLIGIDGGATKTNGLLATRDGKIIRRVSRGPANYRTRGIEMASNLLSDVIMSLLKESGLELNDLELIVGGLAGAHEEFDKECIASHLVKELSPRQHVDVEINNDLYIALVGGMEREYGLATNAGTGAISIGVNETGESFLSDGWGFLLGDDGSGFWIGLKSIKAALRYGDGRGEETSLERRIKEYFSLGDISEILNVAYGKNGKVKVDRIASLSPIVFDEAEVGDCIANDIITRAGEELARTTAAVADVLGMNDEEFPLMLVGGVFNADFRRPLVEQFTETLNRKGLSFRLVTPKYPAEVGSLLLGLRRVHGCLDGKILAAVEKSWGDMESKDE